MGFFVSGLEQSSPGTSTAVWHAQGPRGRGEGGSLQSHLQERLRNSKIILWTYRKKKKNSILFLCFFPFFLRKKSEKQRKKIRKQLMTWWVRIGYRGVTVLLTKDFWCRHQASSDLRWAEAAGWWWQGTFVAGLNSLPISSNHRRPLRRAPQGRGCLGNHVQLAGGRCQQPALPPHHFTKQRRRNKWCWWGPGGTDALNQAS